MPTARSVMRRRATSWYGANASDRAKKSGASAASSGLSQVAAARLTGGGHNAFSRYERGEATPMPAVINLFRLLDKHRSC